MTPSPDPPDADATRTAPLPLTFAVGDLLCDRFRITRFIGRGGMGELYEADDLALGERVAVKTIRPEIALDERAHQRFLREIQLARKVTHPNICRIFDLFQHEREGDGFIRPAAATFVTMELLEGETLRDRLRRVKRLSPDDVRPLVTQMADALGAAHAAGIVHRDFKSSNVMLLDSRSDAPPRVVVTDFGLAYRLDDALAGSSITIDGDLVGTPAYMAPEQIEGHAVTPATDVYALGLVVYEMLTGERPFAGATPMTAVISRLSTPPRPPRSIERSIPIAWNRAVMRCLEIDPTDRFPSAAAFVQALDAPASRKAFALPRWIVAAAAAAAIVAGGGWFAWQSLGTAGGTGTGAATTGGIDRARPAIAVLGFRNLAARPDTEWLSTALGEMLTTELAAGERLRTVPGETVTRMKTELALADAESYAPETLARIRRNLGTDLVIVGSYVVVGSGDAATLRLDIRLQDSREGGDVAVVSETGPSSELLGVVSRAGSRLRERLGVDAVPAALASARASQPRSQEALRLYAEGLQRLRRFDALGARTLLERASETDPDFPLAYAALATAWSSLGYDERAREAAGRAFEHANGLPRAERLQVEGTLREMSNQWKEAIAIWQTLATFFSDDIEYALRLANAQITSGSPKDGLAAIEDFRRRFPETRDPRLEIAESSAAETVSDYKRAQAAALAAATTAQSQGARLLVAAAWLKAGAAALRLGQREDAVRLLEDARRTFADAGDRFGVARTLNNLATAISDADARRAVATYEEGLAIARAIGEQDLIARFLNNLAIQRRRAGDLRGSLDMNRQSLVIRREIGDRVNTSVSLNNIGNVLLDLGDLQGASEHYQQAATISREIGDRSSTARALHNAAEALRQQGALAQARSTSEEALAIRRTIDDPASVATSLFGVGVIASAQGDFATAKRSLNEALTMDRRLDRRRPVAYSLYELAEIARLEGDLAAARRLHQEALAVRTALGEKGTAAESGAALAALALEEGRAAEAETLVRGAISVFEQQAAPDNEATSRATLALALLAQGRQRLAEGQVERAQTLVRNPQHVLARLPVSIAAARVRGATDVAAALQQLDATRADAFRRSIPRYELEARRAAAEVEGRRSPSAAATLGTALRKDAAARGFGLYAR